MLKVNKNYFMKFKCVWFCNAIPYTFLYINHKLYCQVCDNFVKKVKDL